MLGADSLRYLSLAGLRRAMGKPDGNGFCFACFTGSYPVDVPAQLEMDKLALEIPGRRGLLARLTCVAARRDPEGTSISRRSAMPRADQGSCSSHTVAAHRHRARPDGQSRSRCSSPARSRRAARSTQCSACSSAIRDVARRRHAQLRKPRPGNRVRGKAVGLPATIVVPDGVTPAKVAGIRSFGATVVSDGVNFDNREAIAEEIAQNAATLARSIRSTTGMSCTARARWASRSSRTCRHPERSLCRSAAAVRSPAIALALSVAFAGDRGHRRRAGGRRRRGCESAFRRRCSRSTRIR